MMGKMKLFTLRYWPSTYISLLFLAVLTGCGLPSDQALLSRFQQDQAELEELAEMINISTETFYNGDINYVGVASDNVESYLEGQSGYVRLAKDAGVNGFGLQSLGGAEVHIFFPLASVLTLWNFGEEKGFAYLQETPPVGELDFIVPNTDQAEYLNLSETHYFFRHVEGNWYLYKEVVQ